MSLPQIRLVVLCGLIAILDGGDVLSIGIVAPFISRKLEIPLGMFGVVFSVAFAGAAVGALAFGSLADRFSRKAVLVVAMVTFGIATALTAFASSFPALLAIRLLAGTGLGGATPCLLALASDHVPLRSRATVVGALWSGLPLGGMIGSLASLWLLEHSRWEMILYVGGAAPVLLAGLVVLWAPGAYSQPLAPEAPSPDALSGFISPVRELFADGRVLGTLLLWFSAFLAFGSLAIVTLWLPALLVRAGMPPSGSATVIASHGMGAFIGASVAGRLLDRFGTSALRLVFAIGAGLTVILGFAEASAASASVCNGLIGLFVGGGATGLVALATLVYPASMRSTGLGWMIGAARLGQVAAPLVVGWMLQLGLRIDQLIGATAIAPAITALIIPLVVQGFGTAGRRWLAPTTAMQRDGTKS